LSTLSALVHLCMAGASVGPNPSDAATMRFHLSSIRSRYCLVQTVYWESWIVDFSLWSCICIGRMSCIRGLL